MNLLTPLVLLSFFVTTTLAAGCYFPPCGSVQNKSPFQMRWSDLDGTRNLCHVYNWHGGSGGETWADKRVKCNQYLLNAGEDKGGYFHDRIDVDGFTYADRSYKITWSLSGRKYTLRPGVWVKIKNYHKAICRDSNRDGTPECTISII